jgi:hypothetical protein
MGNICDNCPNDYNPFQEDTFPPQGNGIGDACDCEADFNCDGNVDAVDVGSFLDHFGRNAFFNPCINENPCHGDFLCDTDVDATDVNNFLEDFGRSQFFNPCPACVQGDWCNYDSSCAGLCDFQSPAGCYCDASCVWFGDCCPDACAVCGYCP